MFLFLFLCLFLNHSRCGSHGCCGGSGNVGGQIDDGGCRDGCIGLGDDGVRRC